MKKLLYLAVVSTGLFLSSCSMSKDAAYLHSQKLQAKQELVKQTQKQDLASVSTPGQTTVNTPAQNTVAETTPVVTGAKKHSFHKDLKTFADAKGKFVKKAGTAFTQAVILPKVTNHVSNLLKQQSNTAHANWMQHKSDANWLTLWILCLVGAFVFYIIGAILTAAYVAAVLAGTATAAGAGAATIFFVIAYILWIAAVVFFIIWLVQKLRDR
jgi:hypothetical protein